MLATLDPQKRTLAQALDALCRVTGLRWQEGRDGVRLSRGTVQHEIEVAWTPRILERDLPDLAQPDGRPRVLVTTALALEVLRSAAGSGVHMADTGGNGHLELPGLMVHVEGRPVPKAPRTASGARAHHARVLYALLDSESPIVATRRELGRMGGVSLGSLQRHLVDFVRRGWIRLADRRIEVLARREMLEAWQAAWVEALRTELFLTEAAPVGFPHFRAWTEWLSDNPPRPALVGGQLGAARRGGDLLPVTAALHVRGMSVEVLRACRVLPVRGGPVTLLNALGATDEDVRQPGLASPLLVLGELARDDDPRIGVVRRALVVDLGG